MKKNLYATFSAAALLLCLNTQGQIAFGGEPLGIKAEKVGLAPAPVTELPSVDADALMAEDAVNMTNGNKGPYRFGFNHAVDLSTENSGVWSVLADGSRVWRVAVHCPGAYSINFVFGEYVVPQGGRVFVFNDAHEFFGGFTAASNPGHTELGVTQLAGDRITIEYQEPANVVGQGHLRITQVTHAYRDILRQTKGLGDSGSCNNNVICPEGDPWRDQIAAVAMITVGGSGLCTGTLINNCANDGTPYFLTANHCTQGGGNVGTWSFRFNWESPTCTPTTNGPTNQTVSGSTLLVNSGGSDVALLQLNTTPPSSYNVFYSGWDATGNTPMNQTCIHHPSGDIKKISFDYNSAAQGTFSSAQCWHILNWDDGTTEPGSSGSCLLNQDKRIIGQLFGGAATCSNNVDDYFGRFDISFPLLQTWLGGSCGLTLDGYDPNFNPVALDAAVQSVNDVDDSYCNQTSFNPTVTIKNQGTTTLTSLTLLWQIDGGSNTSVNWNGSLATGATATVGLGNITFGNGAHTLTVTSSAPNGGADLNTGNDTRTKDFNVSSPGQEILLNITFDDYGSETTWALTTNGGTPVAGGGPYSDGTGGTTVTESLCLGDGCYNLTMYDGYGDGFCCAFGNGDYEVVDAYGHVYVNGDANFTSQVVTNFCLTNTGITEPSNSEDLAVFPNPVNGSLTVALPNNSGTTTLIVRDALGREVLRTTTTLTSTTLDLTTLSEGSYSLEAVGEHARNVRRVTIQH